MYELSKDFRNEGISYKHSPEFTQLEWYEAYADYRDTMERLESLVERAAQAATGGMKATFRGHEIDLARPWARVKFVEALEAHGAWSRDPDELRAKLDAAGVDTTHDKTWAQLVDHAYSHFVEPELIQPTIVYDWPIEMSPFARTTDDDPAIVERFESVVGGMEFANAFSELNDSEEQAARFAMQADEKAAGDATAESEDPDYVEALSYGMPPTGRPRNRDRPADDGAGRKGRDPGRDPLSRTARTRVGMFERFTERARQVIVLAQGEARLLKHNYIGTEHELLGLIREEQGLAAQALASLGVTLEDVRSHVVRIVGLGEEVATGRSRLRRVRRGSWSFRCARRSRSATTTSARSTSCSASCGRATGWQITSCSTWAPGLRISKASSCNCSPILLSFHKSSRWRSS